MTFFEINPLYNGFFRFLRNTIRLMRQRNLSGLAVKMVRLVFGWTDSGQRPKRIELLKCTYLFFLCCGDWILLVERIHVLVFTTPLPAFAGKPTKEMELGFKSECVTRVTRY